MLERIKKFLSESRQELRHVNWPTRAEAVRLTGIVIGMSLGLAVFLGSFDFIFTDIVRNIVIGNTTSDVASPFGLEEKTIENIDISPEDIEISTEGGEKAGIEVKPLSVPQ